MDAEETKTMTIYWKSAALAGALALSLAACDQSPQHADGATATNDPGTAATVGNGMADTGSDTGAGGDIGGAGEATAGDETATNTATNAPAP
jgi:hypothetical protein